MTRSQRLSLGAILGLQVILGILLAIWLPSWLGHEPDYYNNVRFLVETGRLPARSDFEGAERGADIAQATQGPLFFYVAAPLVALLDDGTPVPPGVHPNLVCDGTIATLAYRNVLTPSYNWPMSGAPAAGLSLRVLNLLLGLGTTTIVYFTARRLPYSTHALALVAAAFAAFFPPVFSLNVFVSGESLLIFISSVNMYFALRLVQGSTVRLVDLLILIATAILGPLAKTNGYALVIGTAVTLVFLLIRAMVRAPRSRNTRVVLIGVALLAVALTLISLFNLSQYGSIIGRYQDILNVAVSGLGNIRLENLAHTLRDTILDYTSTFPVRREKVLWLYAAGGLIGLTAFVLLALNQLFKRDWRASSPNLILLVYACAALALVLIRGNLTDTFAPDKAYAPVRYYLSGIPAYFVMTAVGWDALSRAVFRNRVMLQLGGHSLRYKWLSMANPLGFVWAGVWLSIVVFSLRDAEQLSPKNHLISAAQYEEIAERSSTMVYPENASIRSSVPQIRGLEYAVNDDGMLRLTTFLSIDEKSALNQVATLTISDVDGRSATCEIVPQGGIFPVTRWEPGQIVVVPMDIPNCATQGTEPMSGPLVASIGWREADGNGDFVGPNRSISRVVLETDLPHFSGCMPNLGFIGEDFQVVQFNGRNTLIAGETYLPSVNWYVRDTIDDANLTRVYSLTHKDTGRTFTCQGVPRLGDYPIELWRRGEMVYFDQCAIPVPADAPSGAYTLSIGLRDNATGQFLPVEPVDGVLAPDGLLEIAEFTLEPNS